MHKDFQVSTWLAVIDRTKWTVLTVRKQHLTIRLGYINALVCHSDWRMHSRPVSVSWTLYYSQSTANLQFSTLTVNSSSRDRHLNTSAIADLSQSSAGVWGHFEIGKVHVIYEQYRVSWSRYPSGSVWSRLTHLWSCMRLEETDNTNQLTILHSFVQSNPPFCFEFYGIPSSLTVRLRKSQAKDVGQ